MNVPADTPVGELEGEFEGTPEGAGGVEEEVAAEEVDCARATVEGEGVAWAPPADTSKAPAPTTTMTATTHSPIRIGILLRRARGSG